MKPTPRLSEFLPYMLSVTSNAVSGRIAQEYRSRFGLKVPEWRVMAVLGDAGALTQRDLTALTHDGQGRGQPGVQGAGRAQPHLAPAQHQGRPLAPARADRARARGCMARSCRWRSRWSGGCSRTSARRRSPRFRSLLVRMKRRSARPARRRDRQRHLRPPRPRSKAGGRKAPSRNSGRGLPDFQAMKL